MQMKLRIPFASGQRCPLVPINLVQSQPRSQCAVHELEPARRDKQASKPISLEPIGTCSQLPPIPTTPFSSLTQQRRAFFPLYPSRPAAIPSTATSAATPHAVLTSFLLTHFDQPLGASPARWWRRLPRPFWPSPGSRCEQRNRSKQPGPQHPLHHPIRLR